eukprot:923183-Alexandrium_andersonii.AAC.1
MKAVHAELERRTSHGSLSRGSAPHVARGGGGPRATKAVHLAGHRCAETSDCKMKSTIRSKS